MFFLEKRAVVDGYNEKHVNILEKNKKGVKNYLMLFDELISDFMNNYYR